MSWREEINNIFDGSGSEDLMGFMENKLDEYEVKITELENQIELMKNCGNCKYSKGLNGKNVICGKSVLCEYNPQWEMRI
jgi:bacterioferritin (cytochrome b1)